MDRQSSDWTRRKRTAKDNEVLPCQLFRSSKAGHAMKAAPKMHTNDKYQAPNQMQGPRTVRVDARFITCPQDPRLELIPLDLKPFTKRRNPLRRRNRAAPFLALLTDTPCSRDLMQCGAGMRIRGEVGVKRTVISPLPQKMTAAPRMSDRPCACRGVRN
jgi:hypothetical protein